MGAVPHVYVALTFRWCRWGIRAALKVKSNITHHDGTSVFALALYVSVNGAG